VEAAEILRSLQLKMAGQFKPDKESESFMSPQQVLIWKLVLHNPFATARFNHA
jgi:hypothetical protein